MPLPIGEQTITVVRAPLVQNDRDNTWYRDWENATHTDVPGCSVQPTRLSDKLRYEQDQEREYHMTYIRVYAPPGTDIVYTDKIKFDGKFYDVQGAVTPWRRTGGQEHHVAFLIKLREG